MSWGTCHFAFHLHFATRTKTCARFFLFDIMTITASTQLVKFVITREDSNPSFEAHFIICSKNLIRRQVCAVFGIQRNPLLFAGQVAPIRMVFKCVLTCVCGTSKHEKLKSSLEHFCSDSALAVIHLFTYEKCVQLVKQAWRQDVNNANTLETLNVSISWQE